MQSHWAETTWQPCLFLIDFPVSFWQASRSAFRKGTKGAAVIRSLSIWFSRSKDPQHRLEFWLSRSLLPPVTIVDILVCCRGGFFSFDCGFFVIILIRITAEWRVIFPCRLSTIQRGFVSILGLFQWNVSSCLVARVEKWSSAPSYLRETKPLSRFGTWTNAPLYHSYTPFSSVGIGLALLDYVWRLDQYSLWHLVFYSTWHLEVMVELLAFQSEIVFLYTQFKLARFYYQKV